MPRAIRCCLLLTVLLGVAGLARAGDFALHDGDTVVFLGDSITAARAYGKVIENYTLLRFPERKVRFVNAGRGGDTAAGGLARLERDVLAHGATVLTVAYGVNDIGWGTKADDEHKQAYLAGIRGIVEKCREKKVRVYICSAAVTGADPEKSETDFLQTMCDEGLALSKKLGGGAIDVQRAMRQIQKRVWMANEVIKDPAKKNSLHAADGVHLNDLGQIAMAFAILKGLDAPADVSAATIDAATAQAVVEAGCRISNIKMTDATLEFDRHDEGLPLNQGLFWALNYRFVPIHDELNRYLLSVQKLVPGQYELLVEGRMVGKYSADQLARGVNIASATADPWQPGGPWDAQAAALKNLTDARHELALSQVLANAYDADNSGRTAQAARATAINTQIENLQRDTARPRPYHFVIRSAK
ncbi:MAG: SGNH/GDSL hydrolase family protein [Planctomycetia bacterium]|nr:SGNH/GDSL hydrolase family protein [Planctomycetia bacterium]